MPFMDGFTLEPLPKKWHEEGVAWRERYFPEMPEVLDGPNWDRFYPEVPLPQVTTVFAKPDAFAGFASNDGGWYEPRSGRRWSQEILEELFAMTPGEHVLDAFNIEFRSLLDTSTFLALIDRVGKYQLEMQHHFLYGPMALSMPYMRWLEESYHLAAGEKLLKAIAVAGALDGGNFGLDEVQRSLNMWSPRGLEMFGSELGGAAVKGLFKTLGNDEAQRIYLDEVAGKVRDLNLAVVGAKLKAPREEAKRALARLESGERVDGMGPEDLLRLPHRRFFRIRGLAEYGDYMLPGAGSSGVGYVYLPYDVNGNLLAENGKPVDRERYIEYLHTVLPKDYMGSRHFRFVKDEFLFNPKWGDPVPAKKW